MRCSHDLFNIFISSGRISGYTPRPAGYPENWEFPLYLGETSFFIIREWEGRLYRGKLTPSEGILILRIWNWVVGSVGFCKRRQAKTMTPQATPTCTEREETRAMARGSRLCWWDSASIFPNLKSRGVYTIQFPLTWYSSTQSFLTLIFPQTISMPLPLSFNSYSSLQP